MKKKEGNDKEAAGLLPPYQTYRQGNHMANNKQNILGYSMQQYPKSHSANYGSEPRSTDSI